MSPELLVAKHGEIEKAAELKKAEVEYIINLIESNETRMREIFLTDEERNGDEYTIAEALYTKVTDTLNFLNKDYIRPFGVKIYRFPPSSPPELPRVALGWSRFIRLSDAESGDTEDTEYVHTLGITDEGLSVLNGVRSARGDVSAGDRRKINRNKWEQATI